jgi:alpha-tubulin suppressor-like RCC1 family protein
MIRSEVRGYLRHGRSFVSWLAVAAAIACLCAPLCAQRAIRLRPVPHTIHRVRSQAEATAVLAFGGNDHAQTGDLLNYDYSPFILPVSGLSGVTAVAAGQQENMVLLSNGTVEAWGNTEMPPGSVVEGPTWQVVQYLVPTAVSLPKPATAIAGGSQFSLALLNDGTVAAWGANGPAGPPDAVIETQDGGYAYLAYNTPQVIPGISGSGALSGVTAIAAGYGYSVALLSNGTVATWGGSGTPTGGPVPALVVGPGGTGTLGGITAIAANGYQEYVGTASVTYSHTLALKSDGTVWAWGTNESGELGDGTTTDRSAPVQVIGLTNAVAIAAGANHSIAIENDGSVWTWGANDRGQLGLGSADSTLHTTPARVPNAPAAATAAAGYRCSYILQSSGQLWAWGANEIGELGDGTFVDQAAPERIVDAPSVQSFAVGLYHAVAVQADGTVAAWGNNISPEPPVTSNPLPITSPDLANVTQIVAGSENGFAIRSDGAVTAWGDDSNGLLGDGRSGLVDNTLIQLNIEQPEPVVVPGLANVVGLASEAGGAVAVESDGSIWWWGQIWDDSPSVLGYIYSDTPVRVPGVGGVGYLSGISSASTGLAVSNSGQVYSLWPTTPVSGLSNVVAVLGGDLEASTALKSDGTVWQWGNISDPPTTTPVQVSGLTNVVAITSGWYNQVGVTGGIYYVTYALKGDGTVWLFGSNDEFVPIGPMQVENLANIVSLATAGNGGLALDASGTVWIWDWYSIGSILGFPPVGYTSLDPVALAISGALGIAVGDNESSPEGTSVMPIYFILMPGSTVTGNVELQGLSPSADLRPIRVVISRPNFNTVQSTQSIGPDGNLNIYGLPAGNYEARIKGHQYLQSDVAFTVSNGSGTLSTTLLAGDVNDDNMVNLDDFSALAAAYGSAVGDAAYNFQADLNGDGVVDLNDFSLLAANYGLAGDP